MSRNGKLGVDLGELLLGVELGRGVEVELGRLRRHLAAREELGVLGQAVWLHGDVALVVVADEMDFLDVAVAHHLLNLGPLNLLGRHAVVAEEHPADRDQKQKIKYPGEIDSHYLNLVRFPIVGFLSHHF